MKARTQVQLIWLRYVLKCSDITVVELLPLILIVLANEAKL